MAACPWCLVANLSFADLARDWRSATLIGDAMNRAAGKIGATIVGRARARVSNRVLNRRSGNLLESIRFEAKPSQDGSIEILILAGGGRHDVQYAAIHEYGGTIRIPKLFGYLEKADGTPFEIKMPKRPYIQPSVDEVTPLIPKVVSAEISKALKVD